MSAKQSERIDLFSVYRMSAAALLFCGFSRLQLAFQRRFKSGAQLGNFVAVACSIVGPDNSTISAHHIDYGRRHAESIDTIGIRPRYAVPP